MELLGLHHVAFAHGSDTAAIDALARLLGLSVGNVEAGEGFVERMIAVGDASFVQALEATGAGTVQRFVDRRGPGLHHIAFEVADIDAAVAELRSGGVRMVDETPRAGGMGTRIAFVHPASLGGLLVELVETRGPPITAEDHPLSEHLASEISYTNDDIG